MYWRSVVVIDHEPGATTSRGASEVAVGGFSQNGLYLQIGHDLILKLLSRREGGGLRPICRGMIPEWLFVPDTRDPLDKCKTVLSIGCPLRIWKGAAGDHLQTSDLGVAEST